MAAIDAAAVCAVVGDEGKLKEVIGNLIDNAIKYTPKGSVTVSVTPSVGVVTVKVADTGVGIPAEIVPRLWVESPGKDRGSIFFIEIPMSQPADGAQVEAPIVSLK